MPSPRTILTRRASLTAVLATVAISASLACSSVSDDPAQPPRFEAAAYANGDTAQFVGEWAWIGAEATPWTPGFYTTPGPGTVTAIRVLDGHRLMRQVDGAWLSPQPYRFLVAEPTVPGAPRRISFQTDGLSRCGGSFALDARHFATLGMPCDGGNDYYRRR